MKLFILVCVYLYFMKKDSIMVLNEVVCIVMWEDVKLIFISLLLIVLFVLEFVIYKKVLNIKKCIDV